MPTRHIRPVECYRLALEEQPNNKTNENNYDKDHGSVNNVDESWHNIKDPTIKEQD